MELKATTVGGYLRELPADRRVAMARVCSMIRRSARGVRESMRYGLAFYELHGPLFALESTEKTMTLFIAEPSVVENYKDSVKGVLADRSAICFDDLNRIPLDSLEKIVRDSVAARRERVKTTPAPTQKELLELWKITEEEAKAPPPIVRIPMGKDEEEVQQEVKVEVEEPEKPVEILRAPTFKDPAMTASSQPKNPALKKVAAPAKSPIRRRAPRKTAAAAEDTTAKPKRTRRTKAKTAEE
ncbi:MAG: DUF1801 domain-containing protein [Burkholderiales bacterium]|uniref:DUF1801 domain-containing protein n=1 Tax=uncultured Turicimonas sp. TaxID=1918607 RepID=UPI001EC971F9|nr:DUF1801 domain-containing protein [uncultured Turicimonas sp.]MBS4845089.1 DUF1801 domain-containing protein [Burkholderiales bacterium]